MCFVEVDCFVFFDKVFDVGVVFWEWFVLWVLCDTVLDLCVHVCRGCFYEEELMFMVYIMGCFCDQGVDFI